MSVEDQLADYADGPIEGEETAREKLKKAGFNPDNIDEERGVPIAVDHNLVERNYAGTHSTGTHPRIWKTYLLNLRSQTITVTPMIYFCGKGDLRMCRYLKFVRGASCTRANHSGMGMVFPMLYASFYGQLGVCKWLYEHGGAKDDIRRRTENWRQGVGVRRNNALRISFLHMRYAVDGHNINTLGTCQWLILNGALCPNSDGRIDDAVMRDYLMPVQDREPRRKGSWHDDRPQLLSWAMEAINDRSVMAFMAFMGGIHSPPESSTASLHAVLSSRLLSESAATYVNTHINCVGVLQGKPGITELIADYVLQGKPGIAERSADYVGVSLHQFGRQLRTLRQLVILLRAYIQDTPDPGGKKRLSNRYRLTTDTPYGFWWSPTQVSRRALLKRNQEETDQGI